MTEPLSFRRAVSGDATAIEAIVNGAYRDKTGKAWTSEAHLVAGPRVDEASFRATIARPGSFVLVAERAGRVMGCVHLEGDARECFLSMLSVRADEQGGGIGRALLEEGERFAKRELASRVMAMHVITRRPELLAYYERRGYRRTGIVVPFVPHGETRFLQGPLDFERLEKAL